MASTRTARASHDAPVAPARAAEAPLPEERPLDPTELLATLDFPRGDAAAQARAREVLETTLVAHGLTVRRSRFSWRAGRAVCAGGLWIFGAMLLYSGLLLRGRASTVGTVGAALVVGLGIVALGGGLDRLLPASPAANLEAVVEPRGEPLHEVLLGAHYDSKTELLDHMERVVWIALVVVAAGGALAAIRARPSWARRLGVMAALGVALLGTHFTSSVWLAPRGHGILDDGAACAVLVAQATALHEAPLEHTRVRCVWWAGEETGAQGSRHDASTADALPDVVVNLECLGAGPRPGFAALEWTGRTLARADGRLVASLEQAAGRRLVRLPFPIVSDAGSWLRIGVPAVTVLDLPAHGWAPRHLHGRGDRRDHLDVQGLDATAQLLGDWLRIVDGVGPAALCDARDGAP